MKIVGYKRPNDSKTNDRVDLFVSALGGEFSVRDEPKDCDLAVQAGFQISPAMKDAMDKGTPIIILENPVWGKEDGNFTWAYNGLNRGGFVPGCAGMAERTSPKLRPWRDWQAGDTTIFGQVPNDKALRGSCIDSWIAGTRAILPKAVVRTHPICLERDDVQIPFGECLAYTSLAITYNSTCGSEAVIAGIPTITCHWGSLAWEVSTHNFEDTPITPDRTAWLHSLAYRHCAPDDVPTDYILSGYAEAEAGARAGHYDNMSNGRDQ